MAGATPTGRRIKGNGPQKCCVAEGSGHKLTTVSFLLNQLSYALYRPAGAIGQAAFYKLAARFS